MSALTALPCSHCNAKAPRVEKKSGRAGRISRTPWYRETVTCTGCNISVTAGTPGNAIKFWNRSQQEEAAE